MHRAVIFHFPPASARRGLPYSLVEVQDPAPGALLCASSLVQSAFCLSSILNFFPDHGPQKEKDLFGSGPSTAGVSQLEQKQLFLLSLAPLWLTGGSL